jgi:hypothetical protein
MRKLGAVLGMGAVVLVLAASDLYLLAQSATLSRIARERVEELFGDVIDAMEVRASLDGVVVLRGVRVKLGGAAFRPQSVEEIEILFGDRLRGRIRRITLEGVRLHLSPELFRELGKGESKKSIRDFFPDPDDLPQIVLKGGTAEGWLPAVFPNGPQALLLRECTLTPVRAYRAYVQGIFESPLYGRWSGSGEFDLAGGPTQVRLETSLLLVDPSMRWPLAPPLQRIYDRYLPGGTCDVTVDLWKEATSDLDFKVVFLARQMDLNYKYFPYQVHDMSGEIVFHAKGFRIKHMVARHGNAVLRFDGVATGYAEESAFRFRLELDDVPLDDELRAALQPESRAAWDRFSPTGRVSAKGIAEREEGPDKPCHIPLEVSVTSANLMFKGFPYELRDASGELAIDGEEMAVKRLVARQGGSSIDLSGQIRDLAGDATVDLWVDARAVPLDDRLKKAFNEEVRRTWDLLSPGGALDGRVRLTKEKGKDLTYAATLRARGNTIKYAEFPVPVTDVEGEIEVVPGQIILRHVAGKASGARIGAHGTIGSDSVVLDLDAAGLAIDDPLKLALPAEAGDFLKQLKLTGVVSFLAGYRSRPGGKKEFTVDLKLSKGAVDIDPRIEEIEGHVALEGFHDQELLLRGPISISSAMVAGKRLSDVGASLNVKGPKVNFVNLKATAYGGLVAGKSFSVDMKTGEFYCESVTIDRVDLHEYSLDTQGYSKKALGGKASLWVQDLAGRAADAKTITGRGRLLIRDGQLWDIPVFVSIFTLNPQELFKAKQQFDTGAVDFEIKARRFLIDKLSFSSEGVSLLGRGTVDFDGNLDLVLKTKTGFFGIDFLPINIVTGLFDELKGAFHGVAVKGTFEKPETSQKFFPEIGK